LNNLKVSNFILVIMLVVSEVVSVYGQHILKLPNGSFELDLKTISLTELDKILSTNDEAYELYSKYRENIKIKKNQFTFGLLSAVSGASITFAGVLGSVGQFHPNAETMVIVGITTAGIGLGFVAAFFFSKRHLLTKAIDIYNNQVQSTGIFENLDIGITYNGIGLTYSF